MKYPKIFFFPGIQSIVMDQSMAIKIKLYHYDDGRCVDDDYLFFALLIIIIDYTRRPAISILQKGQLRQTLIEPEPINRHRWVDGNGERKKINSMHRTNDVQWTVNELRE